MAQNYQSDGSFLLYESSERGCFYNTFRCLWCACTEPYHVITTKTVGVYNSNGSQITRSMQWETISDASRQQSCCCCMASSILCCCIKDFATIRLYEVDETDANGTLELRNVACSLEVLTTVASHIQSVQKRMQKIAEIDAAELEKRLNATGDDNEANGSLAAEEEEPKETETNKASIEFESFKSTKPMREWGDAEVKEWINSISSDTFNEEQKQLICAGVDATGCDGDSLACADSAEELKEALEIPVSLARKLKEAVVRFNAN